MANLFDSRSLTLKNAVEQIGRYLIVTAVLPSKSQQRAFLVKVT
jgi:hypothetical protein